MSADLTSYAPPSEGWLSSELSNLAVAHAAVLEAIARFISSLSAGQQGLIAIQRLRFENAVDQYLNWAAEIQAGLEQSEDASPELRTQLIRIQTEFRAALKSKAAELASRFHKSRTADPAGPAARGRVAGPDYRTT